MQEISGSRRGGTVRDASSCLQSIFSDAFAR
jgi:hypothetical protein